MRPEFRKIIQLVEFNCTVLDVACGDGDLLDLLQQQKNCIGYGVERDEVAIAACTEKGISVLHQDLSKGLEHFAEAMFDYILMSNALQEMQNPELLIKNMLQLGKNVIISFPNFSYWDCRRQLFFKGRMPVTQNLQYQWYDTPNIHFFTIADFQEFCKKQNITIVQSYYLANTFIDRLLVRLWPNLFATTAVIKITKNG